MLKKTDNYQDHEIDLKELINVIFISKKFIITVTSFLTIIAILYTLSLPQLIPSYKSHIYFLKPSTQTVLELNKMLFKNETQHSVFYKFLTKAMSTEFQERIFKDINYKKNINSFISSIKTLDDDNHEKSKLAAYEIPWTISATGIDPSITSNFLNELVFAADQEVFDELKEASKMEISIRIEELEIEKSLILESQLVESVFNDELLKLNIEEAKLNLFEFDKNELSLIQIDQLAIPASMPLKEEGRKRSVTLAFQILASFMLSIFLVFIKNIYRFNRNTIN